MLNDLEHILKGLQSAEGEPLLEPDDIADMLWLTNCIEITEAPSKTPASSEKEMQTPVSCLEESTEKQAMVSPSAPFPRFKLKLGRALQPLLPKAPNQTQLILDEKATVSRIAEGGIWLPVLKPAAPRCFSLNLVIEDSPSSFIYEGMVEELIFLFSKQGVFRDVRSWLVTTGQGDEPILLRHRGSSFSSSRELDPKALNSQHPESLIDPSANTLLLYLSDCRSSFWQKGQIYDWLKLWTRNVPTAVLQLLPKCKWKKTELNESYKVQFGSLTPGTPTFPLKISDILKIQKSSTHKHLTIPVISIEQDSLKQWANCVTSRDRAQMPGRLIDLGKIKDLKHIFEANWASLPPQTPEACVELFNAKASCDAQYLARLMSLVPLNKPFINTIIYGAGYPINDIRALVEVYDSCLIEQIDDPQSERGIRSEFVPGVRKVLNQTYSTDEALQLLDIVSQRITGKHFVDLISTNTNGEKRQENGILSFISIANQALKFLGVNYQKLGNL